MLPRRSLKFTGLVTLLAGAIALTTGCADDDRSPSEPAAPERTRVVVYSPHGEDIERDFEASFEKLHPEYDVVAFDMGSTEVRDRLRAERARPQADVWWGAPLAVFMEAADEGLLAPYKPTWADQVAESERDADSRWHAVFKLPIVVGYNRDLTRPEHLPKSWDEVVDPRFAGQIVLRHPLASGTLTTLFAAQIYRSVRDTGDEAAGFAWLLALDRNTASYEPNPQSMYDSIARDPTGKWTLWALSDLVYQSTRSDDPLPFGVHTLTGETPVILDCVALVAGGSNPEGGKLFIEHVTTLESLTFLATRHGKIPIRADVDKSKLPEWMRDTGETPMKIDWKVLAEKSPEWMRAWDRDIESQGQGK